MRTRSTVLFVLLASSLFLMGMSVPPSLLRSNAPALEIRTTIRPVTEDPIHLLARPVPGTYRCKTVVFAEPGSRKVFGPPDIVITPGETGETMTTFGPLTVMFGARIIDRHRAETIVTVTRDGVIVSRQRSEAWLPTYTEAVVPAR